MLNKIELLATLCEGCIHITHNPHEAHPFGLANFLDAYESRAHIIDRERCLASGVTFFVTHAKFWEKGSVTYMAPTLDEALDACLAVCKEKEKEDDKRISSSGSDGEDLSVITDRFKDATPPLEQGLSHYKSKIDVEYEGRTYEIDVEDL